MIKDVYDKQPVAGQYDETIKPVVDIDLTECKKEDRPRLIALVNRLAKSPSGLETLQIAAENGFKFSFFEPGVRCCGACDEAGHWVRLNPNETDDKLVGTLAHECRHAGQFVRGAHEAFGVMDVRSELIAFRAMEADAQTYAVTSCKELALQGDAGPYETFKKRYPEIEKAFDTAYKAAGNKITHEVMTETFEGWYDQLGTKTVYEEAYQIEPMLKEIYDIKQGKEPKLFYDKQTMSGEEAIALAGWTKDGNYYTKDPKRLEGGKFLNVAEASMQDMKEFFEMRKELTGMEPDPSLASIPTRPDTRERNRPKMGEKPMAGMFEAKDRILANKQQYAAEKKTVKQAALAKAAAMKNGR
ncbi:MAG: hypothetical protein J5787_00995 [Alphaproteobacteria bacterium]|nr:hypothetical protein [Alphaproteobacteria bacterium]MBO4643863.1 hypothetical protein [Alphaproteobacteria bacterium]